MVFHIGRPLGSLKNYIFGDNNELVAVFRANQASVRLTLPVNFALPCLELSGNPRYLFPKREIGRMDNKPLSPKYDVVFKNIFGEKHLFVLIDFLKTVLDLPEDDYQDIKVMDPHLLRRHKKEKLGILDLRLSTKSGDKIDVELQVLPQPAIWKRILYYNSRMLTDQIGPSEGYGKISRAVSILISYHTLLAEHKDCHHCFRLYALAVGERASRTDNDSNWLYQIPLQRTAVAIRMPEDRRRLAR
jgi:hypothetical protein